MSWTWLLLPILAFLIAMAGLLYWRSRALESEQQQRADLAALRMWQETALEWSTELRALRAQRADSAPGLTDAQVFNLQTEVYYLHLPGPHVRHD